MSLRCCTSFLTRLRNLPQFGQCYYRSQHILHENRSQNITSTPFIYRQFCNPASKGEVRISYVFSLCILLNAHVNVISLNLLLNWCAHRFGKWNKKTNTNPFNIISTNVASCRCRARGSWTKEERRTGWEKRTREIVETNEIRVSGNCLQNSFWNHLKLTLYVLLLLVLVSMCLVCRH